MNFSLNLKVEVMEEITVPTYFVCPISLEIMKDPVTVPTGITYDRESIEKWLLTSKNTICPVTKQEIKDCELTPNHTLRRVIQSWCTVNANRGVERIPTPKAPITKAQISKLLKESKSQNQRLNCLSQLRSILSQHESNKGCMKSAGAAEFLACIVTEEFTSPTSYDEECGVASASRLPGEEALSILYSLQVSDSTLRALCNGEFVDALVRIMRCGTYESRAYAVMMLKSMLEVAEPEKLFRFKHALFVEVVEVLRDQISPQASKAAMHVLINVCSWGRNRFKLVEANATNVLIDLLLETSERRMAEMILVLLELLCQCAEGRAELLSHGAGPAIVSKKILRVSELGSERGVRIISSIVKHSGTPAVLQEMLQVGAVAKMCLLMQVSCEKSTKEKAAEVLKLHAKAWKDSPCIPSRLAFSYPS